MQGRGRRRRQQEQQKASVDEPAEPELSEPDILIQVPVDLEAGILDVTPSQQEVPRAQRHAAVMPEAILNQPQQEEPRAAPRLTRSKRVAGK